jgi:hypothetical protein
MEIGTDMSQGRNMVWLYRTLRPPFRPAKGNVFIAALGATLLVLLSALPALSEEPDEILRYQVTWNGKKAAHGDISTTDNGKQVSVVIQAVSDGVLKAIIEMWGRINAVFVSKTFKPLRYTFRLKSNRLPNEVVDLSFDHKTGFVKVRKFKRDERESHSEKFNAAYDPVSAAYLLRSRKDYGKPGYVDIYDGKCLSRLFVGAGKVEPLRVKGASCSAVKIRLKLLKMTGGDKGDTASATLWISNDRRRVPLLLTASHLVGTVRFELVQVQRRER